MAVCAWCRNETTTGASCTVGALHVRAQHFDLARFGREPGPSRIAPLRVGHRDGDAEDRCEIALAPLRRVW